MCNLVIISVLRVELFAGSWSGARGQAVRVKLRQDKGLQKKGQKWCYGVGPVCVWRVSGVPREMATGGAWLLAVSNVIAMADNRAARAAGSGPSSPFKNLRTRSSRGNEALICSTNRQFQSLVTSAATSLTGC